VVAVGWLLEPPEALMLSWLTAFSAGAVMLVVALRSAARGNRLRRATVAGMSLLLLSLAGLSWIALDRTAAWPVHAVSALAAMGYLSVMARRLGPLLLPAGAVRGDGARPQLRPGDARCARTRETGLLVGDVFFQREAEERPVGVLACASRTCTRWRTCTGARAFNHALFLCAGALRRCVPQTVEMGRIGEDGFLLLTRSMDDLRALDQLARQMRDGSRAGLAEHQPRAGPHGRARHHLDRPTSASACWRPAPRCGRAGGGTARAMARTAWSYTTRIACFDEQAGQIAELPLDPPLSVA
jgi:hypothetical protein